MIRIVLLCILLCIIGAGVAAYEYAGFMGVLGLIGVLIVGLIALPLILKLVFMKLIGDTVDALKDGINMMANHLKDAQFEIHSIQKTVQPDYYSPEYEEDYYDEDEFEEEEDEFEDEEEGYEDERSEGPYIPPELDWYIVDLTVIPAPPEEGDKDAEWEVNLLTIVDPNLKQIGDYMKKLKDESQVEQEDDEEFYLSEHQTWKRDIGRYWILRDGEFKEVLMWDEENEPDDEDCELVGKQRVKLEISVPKGSTRAKMTTNFRDLIEFDLPVDDPERVIYLES